MDKVEKFVKLRLEKRRLEDRLEELESDVMERVQEAGGVIQTPDGKVQVVEGTSSGFYGKTEEILQAFNQPVDNYKWETDYESLRVDGR